MQSNKIKALADKYLQTITSDRRYLHAHPELSFEEVETGKYISKRLTEIGVDHTTGWADNGVVAIIKGEKESNKVTSLRADFDALPIHEANDVPYKSTVAGKMHACGHDAHTASLLGAAQILTDVKSEFGGTIKLIFQPAEEKMPGGASIMIKEGVLQNPKPQSIIGQHVHPPLEAGKVGIKSGLYMASADEIYLTVNGRGGHGGLPQDCIDTVLMSARIVVALQDVISRHCPPAIPSVLSLGKINSTGGATNVIPSEVKIEGTFRAMDEAWRYKAHEHIKRIAEKTAEAMGGTCDVNIVVGYPCLYNEPKLTSKVKSWMIDYMGADNVVDLPLRLTAEDFSYYTHVADGCFYRLGTGNKAKGITSPVHTPTFDIDESALEVGAGLMAFLALKELEN